MRKGQGVWSAPRITPSPPCPTISTLTLLWQILFLPSPHQRTRDCHPLHPRITTVRAVNGAVEAASVPSEGAASPNMRNKSYPQKQGPPRLITRKPFLPLSLVGGNLSFRIATRSWRKEKILETLDKMNSVTVCYGILRDFLFFQQHRWERQRLRSAGGWEWLQSWSGFLASFPLCVLDASPRTTFSHH